MRCKLIHGQCKSGDPPLCLAYMCPPNRPKTKIFGVVLSYGENSVTEFQSIPVQYCIEALPQPGLSEGRARPSYYDNLDGAELLRCYVHVLWFMHTNNKHYDGYWHIMVITVVITEPA